MEALLHLMVALRLVLAFLVGGGIGYGFGTVQNRATRRYEQLQASGKLKDYTGVMPGSMTRSALLLIMLVAIQVVCPMFFGDNQTQWWVSGGVVAGYGATLYLKFIEKRKAG